MSVIVYSKPTCPHCTATKALLTELGVPFEVRNVVADPVWKEELVSAGLTTVPQIYIDGELVDGGNAGLQALHAAGKLVTMLGVTGSTDEGSDIEYISSDDESEDVSAAFPNTHDPDTVYVLHDNPAWQETYRDAFTRAGVKYVEVLMGDGAFDLTVTPPEGVFFNRVSPSSHTRGKRYAAEHASAVISWLEAHGRRVIGGSTAMSMELSKVMQTAELQRSGVATPHTEVAIGRRGVVKAVSRGLKRSPRGVIVKVNRGGSGAGVHFVKSMSQVRRLASKGAFEDSLDGTWIVQDFVVSPESALYRLEFVQGRMLYALRVDTSAVTSLATSEEAVAPEAAASIGNCPLGEEHDDTAAPSTAPSDTAAEEVSLSNCPADSCNIDDDETGVKSKFSVHPDWSHPSVANISSMLQRLGVDVAGIEVVIDESGEAVCIDANCVNSNHNRSAEKRAGLKKSGVDHVVEMLGRELAGSRPVFSTMASRLTGLSSSGSLASLSSDDDEAEVESESEWDSSPDCVSCRLVVPSLAGRSAGAAVAPIM